MAAKTWAFFPSRVRMLTAPEQRQMFQFLKIVERAGWGGFGPRFPFPWAVGGCAFLEQPCGAETEQGLRRNRYSVSAPASKQSLLRRNDL